MSHDHTTDGPGDRSSAWPTAGRTRRDFLRAAGASAGAAALGAGATGVGSARQGDGPGQDIPTPRLEVDGNLIVDPEGNTVTLRGLNVADPRRLDATAPARGKDAVQTVEYLTDSSLGWHPRVIRVPLQPGDIGGLTPIPAADVRWHDPPSFDEDDLVAYCQNHVDPVVDACRRRGVYVILDFHRHWGAGELRWDDPDLDDEVRTFWDYVAERYGDREHVIFEVYNEPTDPQIAGQFVDGDGNVHEDWLNWRERCGAWIDIIRGHSDNLVLVGSPNYSQHPEGVVAAPFPQDDLAYTYHIYPQHNVSQDQAWDEESSSNESVRLFQDGTAAYEEAPMFVTEFGWEDPDLDTYFRVQGTQEDFGDPFLEFLESSPAISWTAWCADPIWRPVMFTRGFLDEDPFDPIDEDSIGDNPYTGEVPQRCDDLPCEWSLLTNDDGEWMGGVIKDHLEEYKDHNVPQTGGTLEPPAAPEELSTGEVTDSTIELTWSAVADATSYDVFLDDQEIDDTSATSYTFDGLDAETAYDVGVRSRNAEGTSDRVALTVETGEDGEEHPCDGLETIEVDGDTVCNVDGDQYFRDVTGDGRVGNRDVGKFFQHFHLDPWAREEFDFSGNGRTSHGDVVSLFRYVV